MLGRRFEWFPTAEPLEHIATSDGGIRRTTGFSRFLSSVIRPWPLVAELCTAIREPSCFSRRLADPDVARRKRGGVEK